MRLDGPRSRPPSRHAVRVSHRPARHPLLAVVIALGVLGVAGCEGDIAAPGPPSDLADASTGGARQDDPRPLVLRGATVATVIDGDTIDARLPDGTRQRVRLLGIDTPERTTLRTGRTECGGDEARQAAQDIARQWPAITLRADPTQDAYDRFGRLLAYVEPATEAGATYQELMLERGWAEVYASRRSPFERVDAFRDAARRAEQARRGVWSLCGGDFRRPE